MRKRQPPFRRRKLAKKLRKMRMSAFDRLTAMALTPDGSTALIERILAE
ncbi:hypothetical protein ABZX92_08345 [Lentzea sp. NPDC006480]